MVDGFPIRRSEIIEGAATLVVGAIGSVGSATAHAFVREGARLVVAGQAGAKLDDLAEKLGTEAAVLNILDDSAVTNFFEARPIHAHCNGGSTCGDRFRYRLVSCRSLGSAKVQVLGYLPHRKVGTYLAERLPTFLSGILSRARARARMIEALATVALAVGFPAGAPAAGGKGIGIDPVSWTP